MSTTTNIKTEKRSAERSRSKLVPALRFNEFDREWSKMKLGLVSKIITGSTPSTSVDEFYNGNYLFVSPADMQGNRYIKKTKTTLTEAGFDKCRKLKKGSVLFVCIGSTIGKVAQSIDECSTNQQINALEAKENYSNNFIYSLLEKNGQRIKLLAGVQAVPQINKTDFSNFKYLFPKLPEQKKIASFLSAVDEKIHQLTKKKELLEEYKKGVMQQLFSGELRFKDENGNPYPDWEDTLLGDCLKYVQPTKYLVSSTDYDDSFETPVLTAGKTFVLGYTDEEENICMDYPLIIFDDFTTASKYVDFPFKAKSSAMKLLLAKEGVNVKFMFEAMQNIKFEVGGHGRHWISIFSQLVISVPSINEQQKIATYLSSIDTKIESVTKQISQTQSFKRGLLQQMFV